MHTRQEQLEAFGRLLDVMDDLREKCPWDRKQTNQTLRPNTIEETYELCEALLNEDRKNICKELGDVLLHIVFYAKIGSETGDFDIADVCNHLSEKLIFRHPHVYGDEAAKNAEDVSKLWEQVKLKEKGGNKTVLSGIPDALPALVKAYRIQDKAHGVGFDWDDKAQVWNKVEEEIEEFNGIYGKTEGMTWKDYVIVSTIKRDRNNPSIVMWSLGNELSAGSMIDEYYEKVMEDTHDYDEDVANL